MIVDTFTPRVGADSSNSTVDETSQREKANIQQKLDGVLETHKDLGQRFVKLTQERDHLARQNDEQKQSIQNLLKELNTHS